jgi:hypothetical protein
LGDPARPIVNEKFSDFAPAIAELRQEAGQDRRNIVRANMLLTETESARFWPLYDEYRAERQKIGDRRVRLITDFLAQQNSMSEDQARALANEDFAILKGTSELKAKWYKRMTKELSERTVARFFHIDEKLPPRTLRLRPISHLSTEIEEPLALSHPLGGWGCLIPCVNLSAGGAYPMTST